MVGIVAHREVVHFVREVVEYPDVREALIGISEREAEGWTVFERVHRETAVTVDFRRDRSK